ncbi:calponin [Umbelopsis sp. WA50703]
MSSPTQLYGLDKEIAERLQGKHSVEREQQAREWIEQTLGEPFPHQDFQQSLKDGVILCKLIGKLQPPYGKYKASKIAFMQMENIAHFLEGAQKAGVPQHDLFQTVDLFEDKNRTQVVDAIWSLSRHAYKNGTCSTYLGPKLADKHEVEFSPEVLKKGQTTWNTVQYGYNKGATQSGMSFGSRREISGQHNQNPSSGQ